MFFGDSIDDFFDTPRTWAKPGLGFLSGKSFRPAADVFECPDGLVIKLEIPGIEREKIDVAVDGRRLIISGARDFIREHPSEEFLRIERGFGSFRREFEVPVSIDPAQVTAKLELGVLTVTIPGHPAAREIPVEAKGRFE